MKRSQLLPVCMFPFYRDFFIHSKIKQLLKWKKKDWLVKSLDRKPAPIEVIM